MASHTALRGVRVRVQSVVICGQVRDEGEPTDEASPPPVPHGLRAGDDRLLPSVLSKKAKRGIGRRGRRERGEVIVEIRLGEVDGKGGIWHGGGCKGDTSLGRSVRFGGFDGRGWDGGKEGRPRHLTRQRGGTDGPSPSSLVK